MTGFYGEKKESWVMPRQPLAQQHGMALGPLCRLWALSVSVRGSQVQLPLASYIDVSGTQVPVGDG